jgi:hypothetical protein
MRPSSARWVAVLSSTAVAANSGITPAALTGVVTSSPNRDFNMARHLRGFASLAASLG